MNLDKTFNSLPKLIRVILLLVPGVNWVTEVLLRLSLYLNKKTTMNLVLLVVAVVTAGLLGFVDCVLTLVNGDILTLE